ncbi:hypothetical protein GO639_09680 [Staphylococcus aureus]|nr:hypothetical protein [Staphylococcus aureus]
MHTGNESGFVPIALLLSAKNMKDSSADYHEDMTAALFKTWFSEQFLPNIFPNSVIVMDNASDHSRLLTRIPNNNTKKADIVDFMRNHDMEIPEKIPTKKVLLATIKQRNFKKEYIIDSMCETRGNILLRLPS